MTRIADVDSLLGLVATGATVTDAEPVDLLSHALQTAALLADRTPDDVELQLAGLVHDVGWLLGAPADGHAALGGAAVAPLLGARVGRLVEHHVVAKRYLVAVEPEYPLSDRSAATLALQGGPLEPAELLQLEADPDCDAFVALRRADDAAKEPGAVVPGLEHWRPSLEAAAARR